METNKTTKKHVFKVPENYFEDFSTALMHKVKQENVAITKSKQPKRLERYYYLTAVAATLLIFFGIKSLLNSPATSSLSGSEIEEFIEYNPSIALSNELIESLDSEDIKELEKTIQFDQKEINDYVITNIDLEYYLNN